MRIVRDGYHIDTSHVTGIVVLPVTTTLREVSSMFGGLAIGFAELTKPSRVAQGLPRDDAKRLRRRGPRRRTR